MALGTNRPLIVSIKLKIKGIEITGIKGEQAKLYPLYNRSKYYCHLSKVLSLKISLDLETAM